MSATPSGATSSGTASSGAPPSSATPRGPVSVVVPLRDGVSGKSRLAETLDAPARRRLVVALARHVLQVVTGAAGVDRVVVVTADPEFVREVLAQIPAPGTTARATARAFGTVPPDRHGELPIRWHSAEVIGEPPGRPGLNAALAHARDHVRTTSATPGRLLVVHADLPLLTTDDVGAVLAAPSDVVVATDRHGTGTNLLALPVPAAPVPSGETDPPDGSPAVPGEGFRFRFGPGSRAAHEAEAAAHGLTCAVVQRPGTATDVDTTDDLATLERPVGA